MLDSLRMHWIDDFTPSQVRLFAVEIADAVQDALRTGDYGVLTEVIEGREATAEVTASPEIAAALRRPVDLRGYGPLSDFIG